MNTVKESFTDTAITVRANLRVVYVHGRYGDFPVGTLMTGIGRFTIRDAWLETLDAGEYPGTFAVTDLTLYSYKAFEELRTTIRASVSAYALDGYEKPLCLPASLPDPIEEQASPEELVDFSRQARSQDSKPAASAAENAEATKLLISFSAGENWATPGDDYRIDNTIGRANIVKCKTALQALGYTFDPQQQLWRAAP